MSRACVEYLLRMLTKSTNLRRASDPQKHNRNKLTYSNIQKPGAASILYLKHHSLFLLFNSYTTINTPYNGQPS